MNRLTTEASTGRRMKRSVNFMRRRRRYSFGGVGLASSVGCTELLMTTGDAVAQLHLAGGHHHFTLP